MRLPTLLELRPEFQGGDQAPQTPPANTNTSSPTETGTETKKDEGGTQQSGTDPFMGNVILFGGMILLFWFFLIAPERRRRKEHQARLSQLKEKDKIVTMGGIYGTVVGLDEATVTIRIDDKRGTTMKISRQAVSQTLAGSDGEDSQS